jgi:hypothetical protein
MRAEKDVWGDVWFVSGNMFLGVFGGGLFLRLFDEDGLAIKKGDPRAGAFSPTESMVMREYVSIPGRRSTIWTGSSAG